MPSAIVCECSHTLKDKSLTIAFAESATAGKLISEFALIPDCGDILKGSIACYDRTVKEGLFGIPAEFIDKYTAESAEVTEQMAIRLKELIPADVIVAVTGLAADGGSETAEKPVGTMFIHGFFNDEPFNFRKQFDGDPEEVILKTIDAIAGYLIELVKAS
jgi:nicotinamide-nucleotide amidase